MVLQFKIAKATARLVLAAAAAAKARWPIPPPQNRAHQRPQRPGWGNKTGTVAAQAIP
jgi:hypothetical protein